MTLSAPQERAVRLALALGKARVDLAAEKARNAELARIVASVQQLYDEWGNADADDSPIEVEAWEALGRALGHNNAAADGLTLATTSRGLTYALAVT